MTRKKQNVGKKMKDIQLDFKEAMNTHELNVKIRFLEKENKHLKEVVKKYQYPSFLWVDPKDFLFAHQTIADVLRNSLVQNTWCRAA